MNSPALIVFIAFTVSLLILGAPRAQAEDAPLAMSKNGLGIELDLILGGGHEQMESADLSWGEKARFQIAGELRYRLSRRWSVGASVGAAFEGHGDGSKHLYTIQLRALSVGRYIIAGDEGLALYFNVATGFEQTTLDLREDLVPVDEVIINAWVLTSGVGFEWFVPMRWYASDLPLALGTTLGPSIAVRDVDEVQARGWPGDGVVSIGWRWVLTAGVRL